MNKKLTEEQYRTLKTLPYAWEILNVDDLYGDTTYYVSSLIDYRIKDNEREQNWLSKKITNEQDYIDFLEASLITELEEVKDNFVSSDGKLFTSYQYDMNRKDDQRLIKNTKARIKRLEDKIMELSKKYDTFTTIRKEVEK